MPVVRRLSLLVVAVFLVGACTPSSSPREAPSAAPAAPPTPPSTVPAPPPQPPISVPETGLGPGDSGDAVRALEQRLDELHYDVGQVDDVFDDDTAYGVTAFQKVNGLPRTGRATQDVVDRLSSPEPPPALVPAGGLTRVEIDLNRQVLSLYESGSLTKVLSVSTGSGEPYCSRDGCGTAVTPPGSYRVDYHADGWVTSPLGRLYNPVYFDPKRGLAIHGFQEVPTDPESHGCVRIPMSAAEWFPDKAPTGTPVYVSDGETPLQPV